MSWLRLSVCLMLCPATIARAGEPVVLKGQPGWVGALAFSPDSTQLAVGAGDGAIGLFDVTLKKKIADLAQHRDAVSALAFLDGDRLVSGGHDNAIMIHALNEKEKTIKHEYRKLHHGAVLALAVIPKTDRFVSSGIDRVIHEWDVKTKIPARSSIYHTSWVNSLAVDPEGKLLASASSDNSVKVGKRDDKTAASDAFVVKEGEIRSVAFSPEATHIAAGIRYGWVRVWRLNDKKEVASIKAHAGETWSVAFSPDGKTFFSGGGDWIKPSEVRLYETGSWKEKATLKTSGEVLCLAVSPDGRWIAAGTWDRNVYLWDLKEARE